MKKILSILIVAIVVLTVVVEIVEARGPRRHYDTTTEDMMMVAAQQTADGDAKKAYRIYKEMKRLKAEEYRRLNSGADTAIVVFLLIVVGVISAAYFWSRLNDGRVSWISLIIAISSITVVVLWFFYPDII